MLNLLRSDFYRLFKSKSYYICILVLTVLVAGSAFLVDWANRQMAGEGSTGMSALQDGFSYGISNMFSAGNNPLFMAIIIAIFITAEFTHGTMKNVVSKGFPKNRIYLSKLITMIAAIDIMAVVVFIFSTLAAWVITGEFGTFTLSYVGSVFRLIGIELILYAALVSLFVMIGMIVRNTGGVIAINIVGVVSFGPVIYQLLDLIIKGNIHFYEFGLQYNIGYVNNNLDLAADDIVRAICVGIGFFAVSTALGLFAFKKSDIK